MAQEGPIASAAPPANTVGTTQIIDGQVALADMANLASDRLIGRDTAGSGVPEALTVGGGVEFTGSGGIQRSALTGDVTASAGSGSTTIANDAVTYAKMQNMTTDRLLGRDTAGSGDVEELTVGTGLSFTGSGGIGVATAGITSAMLRDSAAVSVIGRSANSTGVPADIAAGSDGDILRRDSGAVGFGAVPVASVTGAAPLASPTFTGTPAAPTAAGGTDTTQLATTEFVTSIHGQRYQIPSAFYQVNIARSQTAVDMDRHKADGSFADTWVAPRAGSVVALTARLIVAVIDGYIELDFEIDGMASGADPFLMTSGSNPSGGTKTYGAGFYPYAAGAAIGVIITTDGTLLPNGTDKIEVWIQVQENGSA